MIRNCRAMTPPRFFKERQEFLIWAKIPPLPGQCGKNDEVMKVGFYWPGILAKLYLDPGQMPFSFLGLCGEGDHRYREGPPR